MSDKTNYRTVFEGRYGFEHAQCDVFVDEHTAADGSVTFWARGFLVHETGMRRVTLEDGSAAQAEGETPLDAAAAWTRLLQPKFGSLLSGPEPIPGDPSKRRLV